MNKRDYRSYWDMDGTDYDIALTIVKDLIVEDAIADLAQLVQMYVNKERRRTVRTVEQETFNPRATLAPAPEAKVLLSVGGGKSAPRLPPTKPVAGKAPQWWADLIKPEFRTMTLALDSSGKARVTWGSCTLEQHQQRAAFLRKGAQRTMATAEQHDTIVNLLKRERCNSLDELALRKKAS